MAARLENVEFPDFPKPQQEALFLLLGVGGQHLLGEAQLPEGLLVLAEAAGQRGARRALQRLGPACSSISQRLWNSGRGALIHRGPAARGQLRKRAPLPQRTESPTEDSHTTPTAGADVRDASAQLSEKATKQRQQAGTRSRVTWGLQNPPSN